MACPGFCRGGAAGYFEMKSPKERHLFRTIFQSWLSRPQRPIGKTFWALNVMGSFEFYSSRIPYLQCTCPRDFLCDLMRFFFPPSLQSQLFGNGGTTGFDAQHLLEGHPKGPPDGQEDQERRRLRALQDGKDAMLRLSPVQAVHRFQLGVQRACHVETRHFYET